MPGSLQHAPHGVAAWLHCSAWALPVGCANSLRSSGLPRASWKGPSASVPHRAGEKEQLKCQGLAGTGAARVCEVMHRLLHADGQRQASRMRHCRTEHCQWHRVVPQDGPPPIACDAPKQSARAFRAPTGNPDRSLTRASCETHPLPATVSPREARALGRTRRPEARGCIHVQPTQRPRLARERDARSRAPLEVHRRRPPENWLKGPRTPQTDSARLIPRGLPSRLLTRCTDAGFHEERAVSSLGAPWPRLGGTGAPGGGPTDRRLGRIII